MNLLKALNSLNPPKNADAQNTPDINNSKNESNTSPEPAPVREKKSAEFTYPNVMQSVLCRHEELANRIKNKK